MNWQVNRLPQIVFGESALEQVAALLATYGQTVLLVTGEQSFDCQPLATEALSSWQASGLTVHRARITQEPSPEWVDACVQQFAGHSIDVVVGFGGGSAIDAAKAVAGLLRIRQSVMDFLEGVGPELPYQGPVVPLIAIPTTAGTGAEATKNAVLSRTGEHGFKKSFRHEGLMPAYAVIDPRLMLSLPTSQLVANGLDAITQLIEGYTSSRANPMTDALALHALQKAVSALPVWYEKPDHLQAAAEMAWAALASGIVLAHTGLGAVHGMVAPLGAHHPIGHGIGCGILLAETTAKNIERLQQAGPACEGALSRYAEIGRIFMRNPSLPQQAALVLLVEKLRGWQRLFALPRLADFGLTESDIQKVVLGSRGNSMKTNPVLLSDADLSAVLRSCL